MPAPGRRAFWLLGLTPASAVAMAAYAATPVVVPNLAGFEGREEPDVVHFPDGSHVADPTNYTNIIDEGGGMIRSTLRNYVNDPAYGWWDGDGANDTYHDRQRAESKGI